ncbi:MAG: DUF3501 family protein [Myxococcota bacterium]
MDKLQREQVVDFQTWTDQRPGELERIQAHKAPRRVHLGDHLTFLFETTDTVRWQVQEMMRVERIVRETDIRHEIDTYNELLGGPGQLGCTLLVEIDDPAARAEKLRAWLGLPDHLYLELEGGERVRPEVDRRQIGEDRLSSVQYLRFDTGGRPPVAIGCDLPAYEARAALTEEQRAALSADLA